MMRHSGAIRPNEFVHNGVAATPGEFPYMVQIHDPLHKTICGGSIIASYLILTAAHCFYNGKKRRKETFTVVAGRLHRTSRSPNEQHREIEGVFIHPEYDRPESLMENDIALIELKEELTFNVNVSSILLPNPSVLEFLRNDTAEVAGWGFVANYTPAGELRKTTVEIWDDPNQELICDEGKMCGRAPSGGNWSDVCGGDSGGALKCLHKEDLKGYKRYACGIVSGGRTSTKPRDGDVPCGTNHGTSVTYTRVSYYLDWILSEIELIRSLYKCPEGYFQCQNYFCVANDFKCDGFVDCVDGSDECDCDPTTTAPESSTATEESCDPVLLQCKRTDLRDCEIVAEAPANASSVMILHDIDVTSDGKEYVNDAVVYMT